MSKALDWKIDTVMSRDPRKAFKCGTRFGARRFVRSRDIFRGDYLRASGNL
jgi:hypothetical protein